MIPGQGTSLGVPAASHNGTAPRCEHLDDLALVEPQSLDCKECRDSPDRPRGLVVCLTCGWVACSDASPNHHAKEHYEETDHPVAAGLGARRSAEMVLRPRTSHVGETEFVPAWHRPH
jgi:uncharacterized UBP type Zn finger protein